jgi:hypothetical protein
MTFKYVLQAVNHDDYRDLLLFLNRRGDTIVSTNDQWMFAVVEFQKGQADVILAVRDNFKGRIRVCEDTSDDFPKAE